MKAKEIVNICNEVCGCVLCELYGTQECDFFYDKYGAPWYYYDKSEWLEEHGNEVF